MFDDMPELLVAAVRQMPASMAGPARDVMAAGLVIVNYLRINVAEMGRSDFIDKGRLPEGGSSSAHTPRIIAVGEFLFALRNQPGFPEFVRRWRTRDMQPVYWETFAARMFATNGFEIHARPETLVKRQDFDFIAIKDGQQVNVEVTSLRPEEFSVNNVRNALNHKRDQLPDDQPSVIFCIHPESWGSDSDLRAKQTEIAMRCFRRTRRVNAVVFGNDWHLFSDDGVTSVLVHPYHPVAHPSPRCEWPHLDILFPPHTNRVQAVGDGFTIDPTLLRQGDFYRWIDHIMGSGQGNSNEDGERTR